MTLAITALLALGAGAAPASAKKADTPGKVKTAAATVNTAGPAEVVTAIASCPKGTKVVGGGFAAGHAGTPLSDINVVTESRRSGKKAWSVTAERADTGSPGPTLPLTAEAYCRSGAGKISEAAATQQSDATITIFTPTATCSRNKTELGGGFSFAPTPNNNFPVFQSENRPFGGAGWSVVATGTSAASSPFATAYAYCQTRDKPLPQRLGTGTIEGNLSGSAFTADTAACSGKRTAVSGGFAGPGLLTGGKIPGFVESRRAGKGWHVTALNLGGGTPSTSFTAFALCD